jgi:hypothetical protein
MRSSSLQSRITNGALAIGRCVLGRPRRAEPLPTVRPTGLSSHVIDEPRPCDDFEKRNRKGASSSCRRRLRRASEPRRARPHGAAASDVRGSSPRRRRADADSGLRRSRLVERLAVGGRERRSEVASGPFVTRCHSRRTRVPGTSSVLDTGPGDICIVYLCLRRSSRSDEDPCDPVRQSVAKCLQNSGPLQTCSHNRT